MFQYFFNQLSGYLSVAYGLSRTDKIRVNNIVTYAINATKIHIGRYGTDQFDRSSQILSQIWLDASDNLMRFNNPDLIHFAAVLKEKSSFWANPNEFDYANPLANEMLLTNVEAQLEKLTK